MSHFIPDETESQSALAAWYPVFDTVCMYVLVFELVAANGTRNIAASADVQAVVTTSAEKSEV